MQQKEDVNIQYFDQIHRNHQYPFIDIVSTEIYNFEPSIFPTLCFEVDENSEFYEEMYNRLIDVMERSLEILKEQQSKKNFKWIKGVEKNFRPIENILAE